MKESKINYEINRQSKICANLQKQISNKNNKGSTRIDPPFQFPTVTVQVDEDNGPLHPNERKVVKRPATHANNLVKSADTHVNPPQMMDRPKTHRKPNNTSKLCSPGMNDISDFNAGDHETLDGIRLALKVCGNTVPVPTPTYRS